MSNLNELPDKVKDIDVIRLNRNLRKICKCNRPHFEVDTTNRLVTCTDCGAIGDAFDVLVYLCKDYERLQEQVDALLEQRKEIARYKPYRVTIKNLEQMYKGGKMLPHCPKCGEIFRLEELIHWSNARLYEGNK